MGEGSSGSSTQTTQVNYPPEYAALMASASNKAQDIAGNVNNFTPYSGQTYAGQSPDQLAAMNLARGTVGMTDPVNQAEQQAINNYGNYSGLDTGTQLLQQYGRPDLYSGLDTAAPILNQAEPYLNASSAGYAQNLINSSGANQLTPDVIQKYMSPYTNDVVNNIARLGQQNLTDNLLPSINKTFVGGGTFGGSRSADFTGKAVRDANESILGQQANALESGYGTALGAANADLNRLTGQATSLGSLAGQDYSRSIEGANTLGNTAANLGSQDASRQLSTAQYLQGLGAQDQTSQANLAQMLQGYGSNVYNQNLKDVSLLQGVGDQEQSQEQAQINDAMQRYAAQQNIPQEQLQTLLNPLGQIKITPGSTVTNSGTPASGSMLGQVAGGLLSLGSLAVPGAGGASALGNIFSSDIRVKHDIKHLGERNGYPWYAFKYIWDDVQHEGVMAQDVLKIKPDAVHDIDGILHVDYGAL